ncbi:MAG: CoA ester lyase [Betaproteobacteria bacterium]|jgi:citrate lyase subunit beta/citryl-CoA lyase
MKATMPVWRSLMYCPVNVEKYVDKAHTRGADVIQLDLEDSVPPTEKAAARKLVEKAAARVGRAGADVVVRFNQPLAMAVRDLEYSICPDVDALACTKVAGPAHVQLLDELVSELEQKRGMTVGHTRFIVMIETSNAFFQIRDIVQASRRIVACNIGGEDFALDNNMQPTGEALVYPKQQMIFAANSVGIIPLGFIDSIAGFGDWEAFRKMVRRSRDFGFMGAGCIHPGQVTIVNEEYTPSQTEVVYARKVIQMDQEAAAQGRGSWSLDGKMIDIPIIVRAQKLIARFDAIKAREAQTLLAVEKK